jgi:hypothetical protein
MKRTLLLVVAWSTATLLAVGVAAAAVGSVRGQVTSVPAVPIRATATSLASGEAVAAPPVVTAGASTEATTIPTGDSGPDSIEIATVTVEGAAETTVEADGDPAATTSTTTAPSASQEQTTTTAAPTTTIPPVSSSTTAASGSTTTTKAPVASTRHTYDLVGGTVSVEVGDGTVVLVGASPKSGFSVRVENAGPQRVEVSFESAVHVSHFSGRFSDGSYVPETEEHDRHDGDDRGGRDHDVEFGN